jgi:hypothetical protein
MKTRRSLADRFWAKVDRRGPDECWPWTGKHTNWGYGQVKVNGRTVLVHRVAYELTRGPIPAGLTIDHVKARGCTRRDCVNPAHLEPVTMAVNILRGDSPTAKNARKITCFRGHDAFSYDKRGWRSCRTCDAARHRRSLGGVA